MAHAPLQLCQSHAELALGRQHASAQWAYPRLRAGAAHLSSFRLHGALSAALRVERVAASRVQRRVQLAGARCVQRAPRGLHRWPRGSQLLHSTLARGILERCSQGPLASATFCMRARSLPVPSPSRMPTPRQLSVSSPAPWVLKALSWHVSSESAIQPGRPAPSTRLPAPSEASSKVRRQAGAQAGRLGQTGGLACAAWALTPRTSRYLLPRCAARFSRSVRGTPGRRLARVGTAPWLYPTRALSCPPSSPGNSVLLMSFSAVACKAGADDVLAGRLQRTAAAARPPSQCAQRRPGRCSQRR